MPPNLPRMILIIEHPNTKNQKWRIIGLAMLPVTTIIDMIGEALPVPYLENGIGRVLNRSDSMKIKMKVLDHQNLLLLNESSIQAGRKQNLRPEQLPSDHRQQYIMNFHFDHKWGDFHDVRVSIILKPGALTAWLDVSPEQYDAIPEVEMSELDWEAAVCVGTPRWME